MNLDLSSLTYRSTIASCLSLLVVISLCAQDLEEVNIRSRPQTITVKIDSPTVADTPMTTLPTTMAIDIQRVDERDPDTYRKQAYIHAMFRHTYYHRLTTSPWSRYLEPKGWSANVGKWRYWSHLKSYLTGNDQNIIILREPEERSSISSPPVAAAPEVEPAPLNEIDTNSLSSKEAPLKDSSSLVSSEMDANTQELEGPHEVEISTPTSEPTPSERPVYQTVTRAPWLKSDEYYAQLKTEDDTISLEVPSEEPMIVHEEVEEIVETPEPSTATIQSPPKPQPEIVIQEETPAVVATPPPPQESVVTTSTPPATPTFSSSLAASAFGSLRKSVPWPVRGRITSSFGIRDNAEARGLSPQNYGIDMLCPAGTVVKAVHGGTVLLARRQSPYDIIVTIKHGDYTTAYYYLITPYVKQGDIVQAGQNIGQLRTSVDEADFHFEIWHNQERLNPELWLK